MWVLLFAVIGFGAAVLFVARDRVWGRTLGTGVLGIGALGFLIFNLSVSGGGDAQLHSPTHIIAITPTATLAPTPTLLAVGTPPVIRRTPTTTVASASISGAADSSEPIQDKIKSAALGVLGPSISLVLTASVTAVTTTYVKSAIDKREEQSRHRRRRRKKIAASEEPQAADDQRGVADSDARPDHPPAEWP